MGTLTLLRLGCPRSGPGLDGSEERGRQMSLNHSVLSCWDDCIKGDIIYSDRNVILNNLFYGADRFRAVLWFEEMM